MTVAGTRVEIVEIVARDGTTAVLAVRRVGVETAVVIASGVESGEIAVRVRWKAGTIGIFETAGRAGSSRPRRRVRPGAERSGRGRRRRVAW